MHSNYKACSTSTCLEKIVNQTISKVVKSLIKLQTAYIIITKINHIIYLHRVDRLSINQCNNSEAVK